jgi:hypothetical protein
MGDNMSATAGGADPQELSDAALQKMIIGELTPHNAPITIVDYDPEWPRLFSREDGRIRAALGEAVLLLEHVGSTSVPGLAAKPIIDMVLVVRDSGAEASYVPALEAAGYVLRIREPEWFEIVASRARTPRSICTFSPREQLRSKGCCAFGTGFVRTTPTATFTSARSRSCLDGRGATCSTTPKRSRRWWRGFWCGRRRALIEVVLTPARCGPSHQGCTAM